MSKKGVSVGVKIEGDAKGFKSAAADAATATGKLKDKATKDAGGIGGAFKSMGGVVGNAIRSISNAFKVLMANPIVLFLTVVVGAIMGLVKAFKSTDSGGTALAAKFEQLKAILDVFRQRVIKVADAIGHIFKGEWKEAGQSMKEAFTDIGEALKDATAAAKAYAYEMDNILDREANYISKSAQIRNRIAKLEYTAQDRRRSTSERRAALKEAIRLGEEEVKVQQGFAEAKYKAEVKKQAFIAGVNADELESFINMTDEEQAIASDALKTWRNNNEDKNKELEQLYANSLDIQTRFFEEQKRNISKLSGFEIEAAKEVEAAKAKIRMGLPAQGVVGGNTTPATVRLPGLDSTQLGTDKKVIESVTEAIKDQTQPVYDLANAFNSLSSSVNGAAASWLNYIGNILSTVAKAIAAISAVTAAHKIKAQAETEDAAAGAAASVAGTPVIGAILAVAAVASVLASLANIPKLAQGALAYGPSTVTVGEYSGARNNPEVIAPLNKLKGLMGGQNVYITLDSNLMGRDISLSANRYLQTLNKNT